MKHYPANTLPKNLLLEKVQAESFKRIPVSFYRYVLIDQPTELRNTLFEEWSELEVLGRVAISQEGINAQLSVPQPNMAAFRASVDSHPEFNDVPFKFGIHNEGIPFWKLVIRARNYILADGLKPQEYDVTNVGTHLTAKEFNDAIDSGAIVVDMRNIYESDIGRFEGAVCPEATTFKEELPMVLDLLKEKKAEKILLYCTGGIRCEKASAYLKHHGFQDVNQLHGGIIDYKHQIDAEGLPSKYKGVNFVFDGRDPEVITDDVIGACYQCKAPAVRTMNCSNKLCHVLFIQCDTCHTTFDGACSTECQTFSQIPEPHQTFIRRGKKEQGRIVLR